MTAIRRHWPVRTPRSSALAIIYAVWALPLLITLVIVTPPWTVTDEPFHMLRAVSLAHGHIIGTRFANPDRTLPVASGGMSDGEIYAAFAGLARMSWLPDQPNGQVTAAMLRKSDAVKWSRLQWLTWFGSTAQYPPAFYLPDMLSYWVGRACGLHINTTLRLARGFNALLFVAGAALAIARARRLRLLMTAILMLPTSLALAASANQDAALFATTALVVAQLDRIADAARRPNGAELAWMAVGLTCVAAARPPYAFFLLLLVWRGTGMAGRAVCAAAAASVVAWCGLVAAYVMVPMGESHPAAQLALVLTDPMVIFAVAWNTLLLSSGTYAWEFVGKLGWNDFPLPAPYLGLAGVTLAMAALGSAAGPAAQRAKVIAGCILTVGAIFIVQFLDWTPPGTDHVTGVAGRYFIPIALVAGLALPQWPRAPSFRQPAILLLSLFAAVTPGVMLHHIVVHYYLKVA
jgi:hypothetical protein